MVPSGLVAVVRASSADECRTVVRGLVAAGVGTVEVTLTVPGALVVIEELAGARVLVGAGTVLDPRSCQACIDAGARFIVSPVYDEAVHKVTRDAGVGFVPGALTPSEVVAAMHAGIEAVKIFPIGLVGGPSYLRALREPFPELRAVVSGGVGPSDYQAYQVAGAYAICMGGALVDRDGALAGDVEAVERHARKVLEAVGLVGPLAS